jgi:hypothetical protein
MNFDATAIAIPESVFFLFQENNEARMMEFDKNITSPDSFDLEETLEFYTAKQSIEVCRMELFQFMSEVFQKIWLKPVRESGFTSLTVKAIRRNCLAVETADEFAMADRIFHPQSAWDDKYHGLYWYFTLMDCIFCCGCYIVIDNGEHKLRLCFYVYDKGRWIIWDDLSAALGTCWQKSTNAKEFCLNIEDCPSFKNNHVLDISKVAAIAAKAVTVIKERFCVVTGSSGSL